MLFSSKQHNKYGNQIHFTGRFRMRNWRNFRRSVFFWIAAAAWCGVLFYFSGQSGAESSALSMRVTRFVLRLFPFLPFTAAALNPILRDFAHFGIFAVEGFLLGIATMSTLPRRVPGGLLAALSCAAVAAANEYHQSFVAGRACEAKDMLVDSGGALVGVLMAALALALALRIARRRKGTEQC